MDKKIKHKAVIQQIINYLKRLMVVANLTGETGQLIGTINILLLIANDAKFNIKDAPQIRKTASWLKDLPIGDKKTNQNYALKLLQLLLEIDKKKNSVMWAETQTAMGMIYASQDSEIITNRKKAINCFEKALEAINEKKYPQEFVAVQRLYALIQFELGCHLTDEVDTNATENLESAVKYHDNSLKIARKLYPPDSTTILKHMQRWGVAQYTLGTHYFNDQARNIIDKPKKILDCYNKALLGLTEQEVPVRWAQIQYALGITYLSIYRDNDQLAKSKILTYLSNASKYLTEEESPQKWADVQCALGTFYYKNISYENDDDANDHEEKALQYFESALKYKTEDIYSQVWSTIQFRMGFLYAHRFSYGLTKNHIKGVECLNNALKYINYKTTPSEYCDAQYALGVIFLELYKDKFEDDIFNKAKKHLSNSLKFRTERQDYLKWADIQFSFGKLYFYRINDTSIEDQEKALKYFNSFLKCIDHINFPMKWSVVMYYMGHLYSDRIEGNRRENKKNALDCFKNSLRYCTEKRHSSIWATIQYNLGMLKKYGDSDERKEALEHFFNSLRYKTEDSDPVEWAYIQYEIATLHQGNFTKPFDKVNLDNFYEAFEYDFNQQRALAYLNNALKYITNDENSNLFTLIHYQIGAVYANSADINADTKENLEEAFKHLRLSDSTGSWSLSNNPEMYFALKLLLGKVHLRLNRIEQAVDEFNKGIAVYKKQLHNLDPIQSKKYWNEYKIYFIEATTTLIQNELYTEVLHWLEFMKSRSLLIDIDLSSISPPPGDVKKIAKEYWEVCRRIRGLRSALDMPHKVPVLSLNTKDRKGMLREIDFKLIESVATQKKDRMSILLKKLSNKRAILFDKLKKISPEYVNAIYPKIASFSDLNKLVTDSETAAISIWNENKKTTHLLCVFQTPKSNLKIEHKRINVTNDFINVFNKFYNDPTNIVKSDGAHPLDVLLKHIGGLFQDYLLKLHGLGIKKLYISAHGIFQAIPLHAARLIHGSELYVRDLFKVSYLPSLSLGLEMAKYKLSPTPKVKTLALFYAPKKQPLPSGSEEYEILPKIYGENNLIQLDGKNATIEALSETIIKNKNEITNISIACHGRTDENGFFLHLYNGDVHHSRMLNRLQLYGIHVSLNACNTGQSISWINHDDEYKALDSFFHLMGAYSCISTFYPISDKATSYITIKMHSFIQKRESISIAFQKAIDEYLQQNMNIDFQNKRSDCLGRIKPPEYVDSDHPVFWAYLKYSGLFQ